MIVSFASGKGGTGKTMLATNLAAVLSARLTTTYVDADVEEPNGHLFLRHDEARLERAAVSLPKLEGVCTGCGACQKACAFHAILALKDRVMAFPELCHSCGACCMVCPEQALVERPFEIGSLVHARLGALRLVSGRLDVGQARATPLVEAVVRAGVRGHEDEMILVDSPPGTSCAAMAAVRHADLVVLVTEPTPFGLNDLRLAVEMCRAMERRIVAVVNRADLGDGEVLHYLEREGIPMLGQVPFERSIATAYARGELATTRSGALRAVLDAILAHIELVALDGSLP